MTRRSECNGTPAPPHGPQRAPYRTHRTPATTKKNINFFSLSPLSHGAELCNSLYYYFLNGDAVSGFNVFTIYSSFKKLTLIFAQREVREPGEPMPCCYNANARNPTIPDPLSDACKWPNFTSTAQNKEECQTKMNEYKNTMAKKMKVNFLTARHITRR